MDEKIQSLKCGTNYRGTVVFYSFTVIVVLMFYCLIIDIVVDVCICACWKRHGGRGGGRRVRM